MIKNKRGGISSTLSPLKRIGEKATWSQLLSTLLLSFLPYVKRSDRLRKVCKSPEKRWTACLRSQRDSGKAAQTRGIPYGQCPINPGMPWTMERTPQATMDVSWRKGGGDIVDMNRNCGWPRCLLLVPDIGLRCQCSELVSLSQIPKVGRFGISHFLFTWELELLSPAGCS